MRSRRWFWRWWILAPVLAILGTTVWAVWDQVGIALTGSAFADRIAQRAAHADAENGRARSERRAALALAGPVTSCGAPASARQPIVCLRRTSPASVPLGAPVRLRLMWRNLPDGAYIRVWSANAAPLGTRFRYAGPQGAVTERTFGNTPNGAADVEWDGMSVYCAPADAPMMCDVGEVGTFILNAAIMTGTDPFWPSWPDPTPVPVRVLARADPREVEFTGPPRPLGSIDDYRGSLELAHDALGAAVPDATALTDPRFTRTPPRFGPWRRTLLSYCAHTVLRPPLAGRMAVCFPRSRRDRYGIALRPWDMTASGDARTAPGMLSGEQAERIAEGAAFGFVRHLARFDRYPTEAEIARFGPQPRNSEDLSRVVIDGVAHEPRPGESDWDFEKRAQRIWESRITYAQRDQTYAEFRQSEGRSFWRVWVDQVVKTMAGDQVDDFVTHVFRVDHDERACLLFSRNRELRAKADDAPLVNGETAAALRCPAPGRAPIVG